MRDKVLISRIPSTLSSSFGMDPTTSGRTIDKENINSEEVTSAGYEVDPISNRTPDDSLSDGEANLRLDGEMGDDADLPGILHREYFDEEGDSLYYLILNLEEEKITRRIPEEISLEYYNGDESDNLEEGFLCYLSQFNYELSIPLCHFVKGIMNGIRAFRAQLNGNVYEVICVCKALNSNWIWNDNMVLVKGKCIQRANEDYMDLSYRSFKEHPHYNVAKEESFIDVVAREGNEVQGILDELGISRHKRVNNKSLKVQKAQAKRKMTDISKGGSSSMALPPVLDTSVHTGISVPPKKDREEKWKSTLSNSIAGDGEEIESALKKRRLAHISHVSVEDATQLPYVEIRINDDMLGLENSFRTLVVYKLLEVKSAVEVVMRRVLHALKGLVLGIRDGKDLFSEKEVSLKKRTKELEKELES
ncbi:hypothetical protein GIB67_009021 [Kingdonia uniflora]|uniref:Uncharacterized protein n=1 Tax=Kingdonia uniflora TaxID=39325 RepID=A0A7J7LVU0_9MAGN|nr:hypothetical protein GIB67_009021 [Kingdonia uniflora]